MLFAMEIRISSHKDLKFMPPISPYLPSLSEEPPKGIHVHTSGN